MSNKHDIETYSRLERAADYFLHCSFTSLQNAMRDELKGLIYLEEIMKIDVSEKDKMNFKKAKLPTNPVELLQSGNLNISGDLMNKFLHAGYVTEKRLLEEHVKFNKEHKIGSIEILGHLNNFGFFIETVINRHLLFLLHIEEIDSISYNRISIAKIMERIIYLFKDELKKNKIQLNEIINLFSLRNKTVHFTPDNAIALNVKLIELYRIWNQTIKLLKVLEKKEKFKGIKLSEKLGNSSNDFQQHWN
ncbi:hypothetical protein [Flavobacterium flavigenum]|uniref:hypothetical protein n=1 Tax=Flavobacterium flavigenum TaxID=3003258 RepID=UPI0022AC03F6|nr:hypothetical protein [Flavobacterium flavigenum]